MDAGPGSLCVGIDYLPAVTHWPGVGRYARELVRALVRLPDCPELRLLEWGGEARSIGEPWLGLARSPASSRVRRLRARLPRRALGALARLGFGPERLLGRPQLFHRIHPHWPQVREIPQLQPVPELPPEGSQAEAALRPRLQRMDGLLVASAHCSAELQRRFGIARERIHQVPTGCEHWQRELAQIPARVEPAQILVLGALRPERQHAAILAAFELLYEKRRAGSLVWVGPAAGAAQLLRQRLAASPAREAVQWFDQPIEPRMPALVATSSLLVHLSSGEETPVTPLEAFAGGIPVLASRLGAFEEALGSEAHWADPDLVRDPPGLARAMLAALAGACDAAAVQRRMAVSWRFRWEANARATLAIWRRMAGQP